MSQDILNEIFELQKRRTTINKTNKYNKRITKKYVVPLVEEQPLATPETTSLSGSASSPKKESGISFSERSGNELPPRWQYMKLELWDNDNSRSRYRLRFNLVLKNGEHLKLNSVVNSPIRCYTGRLKPSRHKEKVLLLVDYIRSELDLKKRQITASRLYHSKSIKRRDYANDMSVIYYRYKDKHYVHLVTGLETYHWCLDYDTSTWRSSGNNTCIACKILSTDATNVVGGKEQGWY